MTLDPSRARNLIYYIRAREKKNIWEMRDYRNNREFFRNHEFLKNNQVLRAYLKKRLKNLVKPDYS